MTEVQVQNLYEPDFRGLDEVKVNLIDLSRTVESNLVEHRSVFEKAMEGYKARAIQLLEEHIDRVKNNDPEFVYVSIPMPEDHSADYEQVIELLQWSQDEFLVLSKREFAQYVLDDWGWKKEWTETTAMYTQVS